MKVKKLYLISQDKNSGYDTYDSAVVVAYSAKLAQKINPNTPDYYAWTKPTNVKVQYIGIASSKLKINSVVCASFNAG